MRAEKSRLREVLHYLHEASCDRRGGECLPLDRDVERVAGFLSGGRDGGGGDLTDAAYVRKLAGDGALVERLWRVIVAGRGRPAKRIVDGARADLLTFKEVAECEDRTRDGGVQTNPARREFDHVVAVLADAKQVNTEIVVRRRKFAPTIGKRVVGARGDEWAKAWGTGLVKTAPI